jgi:hypothetical protein
MSFSEEVKKYVDKGVEVSKDALTKAGSAVQKFGDESVVRLEKIQLEKQLKDDTEKLGKTVYEIFAVQGMERIEVTDESVASIVNEMKKLEAEIVARKNVLKESRGK